MKEQRKGRIIVLSGPSGTGKGTVVKELLKRHPDSMRLSVSATTRQPREEDVEGVSYWFYSREQFEEMIRTGQMLEYAEYCGNLYGTPKRPVEELAEKGFDVILEIEVQGGGNVKKICPEASMIFVMPPSAEELKRRLEGRGSETEESLKNRLSTAVKEMDKADQYAYILINDVLADAVDELEEAVNSGSRNVETMLDFVKGVQNDVKTLCS